ncbi:methionine synthase [Actinosynnema mirum]|uniref:Methionine synthase vitamin-B12 independent n=1 Tax=Actinosynnema mirum (strain ATCC 29888 / DSM 43827 / JCM 3225 / NBRC 14064 / NCIMB 13271 / NRRL B-12336 / IMRU 3971 / 101) TaxID=446462 RepID=C6WG85_ACTMD|nr:methionine synthase [Actinosynnema mirum]ACU39849.1 Methionine synthase vitamin-B12 independent [Actinosynnema mirum DSM 43827]
MDVTPWPAGAATGIGSLPGTDPHEAARLVFGELPDLPHLPELPARGVGADLTGRTAALLVDLPVEVVPSGYRVAAHPGRDHRRAQDLLSWDLDALEEAAAAAKPAVVKVQAAGPWTLAATVELVRGHRVLTDQGALREFTESLVEGLSRHTAEVARRTGAKVVVQLDEPALPSVLRGLLPTPSKLGTVAAVPEPEALALLQSVVEPFDDVIVHCCAPRPPVNLMRRAGAKAVALDVSLVERAMLDELGEAWQEGLVLLLGLLPGADPAAPIDLRTAAKPALDLADRLGFPRSVLATHAVPTPSCGMAGASLGWVRRALALSRDLGKAFLEPPDTW